MFEVIISHVRNGRVQRGYFGTRDEADQYIAGFAVRLAFPKNPRHRPKPMRDYRIEVVHREPPVVRQLPAIAEASAA
jgi:hypothetical protein